jgi:hypothetical protein
MAGIIVTGGGSTVDYDGPTTAEVTRTLTRAGHKRYTAESTGRTGFVTRKPRDVSYVLVSDTSPAMADRYARGLRAAGFVVEPAPQFESGLLVFKSAGRADV